MKRLLICLSVLLSVSMDAATTYVGNFTGNGGGLTNHVFYIDAKKNFNAVGNGIADDTVPLQNALTALTNNGGNSTLYIPPGTYKTTATLTFPEVSTVPGVGFTPVKGNITVMGAGWANTVILATGNNVPAVSIGAGVTASLGITVKNLMLRGPLVANFASANTSIAVVGGTQVPGDSGEYWLFDHVQVQGFNRGIAFSNVWAPKFETLIVSSNRLAGVELNNCHYTEFRNCEIFGWPGQEIGNGVLFDNAASVEGAMYNCSFTACTNAVRNNGVTLAMINCQVQNCGTALNTTGGLPSYLINCGLSDLFGAGPFGVTNHHPGLIEMDGISAHCVTVSGPVIETDGSTPNRVLFYSYQVATSYFDFDGTTFYFPKLQNYPGVFQNGIWSNNVSATTAYKVYPESSAEPHWSTRLDGLERWLVTPDGFLTSSNGGSINLGNQGGIIGATNVPIIPSGSTGLSAVENVSTNLWYFENGALTAVTVNPTNVGTAITAYFDVGYTNLYTNGSIVVWPDLSANHFDLTNSGAQSTWPTTISTNGLNRGIYTFNNNSIRFAANGFLRNTLGTLTQPFEVVIVEEYYSSGAFASGDVLFDANAGGRAGIWGDNGSANGTDMMYAGNVTVSGGTHLANKFRVVDVVFAGANSLFITNNVVEMTGNPGTDTPTGFRLSTSANDLAGSGTTDFKCLIIYGGTNNPTVRGQVFTALKKRFNIVTP